MKAQFFELQALTKAPAPLDIASIPTANIPRLFPSIDLKDESAVSSSRFHVWFEQQAAENPDLLALFSGEQSISVTYGQLNASANQRAHCKL